MTVYRFSNVFRVSSSDATLIALLPWSHFLNSTAQFVIVLTGTMIKIFFFGKRWMTVWQKVTTCNVLPKPIECARMHPNPSDSLNW